MLEIESYQTFKELSGFNQVSNLNVSGLSQILVSFFMPKLVIYKLQFLNYYKV